MTGLSLRALPLLLALTLLTACETVAQVVYPDPPPECPRMSIVRATSFLTRFAEGPGRDITDILLEAELTGFNGWCELTKTGMQVSVMTNLTASLGPRATGRDAKFGYYVALVKDGKIRTKSVIPLDFTFPSNSNRIQFRDDEVMVDFPLAADELGRDYEIFIGFQLTPEELEYNRKRPK